MFEEANRNYKLFTDTYQSLKKDYEDLLGQKITFDRSYKNEVVQVDSNSMKVAELSARIQKLI